MWYRHLARVVLPAVVAIAAAGVRCPALDRDLVADYGADPAADASAVIQRAVEEVGTAGGGVVHIPGVARPWSIGRPVFVEYPNVTLAGDGSSTALRGGGTMLVLGMRRQYAQAITDAHFPPISGEAGVLDASVKDAKFGLRTFAGTVRATGFFPACTLAHGGKIMHVEGENFWGDYARGVGKPI